MPRNVKVESLTPALVAKMVAETTPPRCENVVFKDTPVQYTCCTLLDANGKCTNKECTMSHPSMVADMEKLFSRAVYLLEKYKDRDGIDLHWEVCNTLASEFLPEEDPSFPMWLMFVVSGQMREMNLV